MNRIRHNWTLEELKKLYHLPILELIPYANEIHKEFHSPNEVQFCTLISVKTGGCPENCKYCSQSSHYQTSVQAQPMMELEEVLERAKNAIERGTTRICLGAAWREVKDNHQFEKIIDMVQALNELGVEVCCTLGMLKEHQATRLAKARLYAYNHNLDTSRNYYKNITTTRTYDERLRTLNVVEKAGLSVCCGGIIGMGESIEDRLALLHTLATRPAHPESVPINQLYAVEGTPFGHLEKISCWEVIRVIAVARIIMPASVVRISAGRKDMTYEQQALCFLAGANSVFVGDRYLTVPNSSLESDQEMIQILGIKSRPAHNHRQ